MVVESEQLSAYSVNSRSAEPEVLGRTDVRPRGRWSAYEVQSGFVKDRLPGWFSPEMRVDRQLLANLRQVVQQLERDGVENKPAEALMAQVIFLCYLEQLCTTARQAQEFSSPQPFAECFDMPKSAKGGDCDCVSASN